MDTIKKAVPKKKDKDKAGSSISADDAKRLEKEVSYIKLPMKHRVFERFNFNSFGPSCSQIDDLTKKFIKTAEDMCKAKEKEITVG